MKCRRESASVCAFLQLPCCSLFVLRLHNCLRSKRRTADTVEKLPSILIQPFNFNLFSVEFLCWKPALRLAVCRQTTFDSLEIFFLKLLTKIQLIYRINVSTFLCNELFLFAEWLMLLSDFGENTTVINSFTLNHSISNHWMKWIRFTLIKTEEKMNDWREMNEKIGETALKLNGFSGLERKNKTFAQYQSECNEITFLVGRFAQQNRFCRLLFVVCL